LLVLLAVLTAAPALGAEPSDDSEVASSSTLAAVVVTAERRAEPLKDVPISVTALNGSQLQQAGVTDIQSLPMAVPSYSYTGVGPWAGPIIRGLYSQVTGPGQGTGVAVYVDGVYQMSQQGSLLQLPDIENIQVLEGPQGTLFGRNSESGAVLINTNNPSTTKFSGSAEVGAGNYGMYEEQGYLNIPLTSTLAASVSAYAEKNEGYWYDLTYRDQTGQLNVKQFRTKILFQPSDAIQFILEGTLRDALNDGTAMMVPVNGDTIGTPQVLKPWQVAFNEYPYGWNNVRSRSASLQGKFDLGGGFTLTSTSAYQTLANYIAQDGDATDADAEFNRQWDKEHSFSQEFLLNYNGKTVNWVSGLNYFNSYGAVLPAEFFGTNNVPQAAIFTEADGNAYAAFGNLTWHATDRVALEAGVRLSQESKEAYGAYATEAALIGMAPASPRPGIPTLPEVGSKTWRAATPRASVVFTATDSTNLYATFSEGFKSGTYPSSSIGPAVDPEKLYAFEVGSKSQWQPFSLNTALYYYIYKDIQTYATLPSAAGSFFINAASAKLYGLEITPAWNVTDDLSVHGGINLEHTEYTQFDNAIAYLPKVGGGGNYTVLGFDATGDQLERAPKASATLEVDYGHSFSAGRLFTTVSGRYESHWFYDNANSMLAPTSTLVDAQLGWAFASTPLTLTLWGKNLTNAQYWVTGTTSSLGDITSLGPPRTWGLRAKYEF
jgi:iron complex outermembrane receptor protein